MDFVSTSLQLFLLKKNTKTKKGEKGVCKGLFYINI